MLKLLLIVYSKYLNFKQFTVFMDDVETILYKIKIRIILHLLRGKFFEILKKLKKN